MSEYANQRTMTMTTYILSLTSGATFRLDADTYDAAVAEVRLTLGAMCGCDVVLGHAGDLADGGDRTLVWESEADAENDDGARAVAEIRRRDIAERLPHVAWEVQS